MCRLTATPVPEQPEADAFRAVPSEAQLNAKDAPELGNGN